MDGSSQPVTLCEDSRSGDKRSGKTRDSDGWRSIVRVGFTRPTALDSENGHRNSNGCAISGTDNTTTDSRERRTDAEWTVRERRRRRRRRQHSNTACARTRGRHKEPSSSRACRCARVRCVIVMIPSRTPASLWVNKLVDETQKYRYVHAHASRSFLHVSLDDIGRLLGGNLMILHYWSVLCFRM